MEKGIVSEDKNKPVLDEKALAKLLEAAYVLQEHNREMRALELSLELKRDQVEAEDRVAAKKHPAQTLSQPAGTPDYTLTLAQIVETQHHIQVRQFGLQNAMTLVAERVIEIARAGGAAIGFLEGASVSYRAAAGSMTLPKGTRTPLEQSLCLSCLKTGQVFRCADVNPEFLLDAEECRRRGIASMIAVPIFHNGAAVGGLELYYSSPQAFTEQDVHTCQLMAGLVTEALVREEELTWKKSLATERAALLDALEKLQPNLAALIDHPPAKTLPAATSSPARTETCRKCGHKLVGEEQFCGQCGSPRSGDYEPPSMQSKVASLWQMQEARKKDSPTEATNREHEGVEPYARPVTSLTQTPRADSIEKRVAEVSEASNEASGLEPPAELLSEGLEDEFPDEFEDHPEGDAEASTPEAAALVKQHPANWSSAASAREFLEQLASDSRSSFLVNLWNTRRGDIYLAIAVILVACVMWWGMGSRHPVSATATPKSATGAHHKSPDPGLSLFDRMLISLGLAEAPESPEDKGNPTVQVWVDTHTALYYCPGAELYGKTPTGKFTTQRAAQLDQFQPASRKACN